MTAPNRDPRVSRAAVDEAIENLHWLTTCRCSVAFTGRGRHATECASGYRHDLDVLIVAIGRGVQGGL